MVGLLACHNYGLFGNGLSLWLFIRLRIEVGRTR